MDHAATEKRKGSADVAAQRESVRMQEDDEGAEEGGGARMRMRVGSRAVHRPAVLRRRSPLMRQLFVRRTCRSTVMDQK